jgi:hypothetical protein
LRMHTPDTVINRQQASWPTEWRSRALHEVRGTDPDACLKWFSGTAISTHEDSLV